MSPLDAIHLHLRLEAIGIDASGALVRLAGADPDEIPRYYAARYDGGCVVYCRQDIPMSLRAELGALACDHVFRDDSNIRRLLAEIAPAERIWHGRNYLYTGDETHTPDTETVRLTVADADQLAALDSDLDPGARRVYGVWRDERIVALCASARENEEAASAWVTTLPAYRGRGYGRAATLAWAQSVQREGKSAIYSHQLVNRASAALVSGLPFRLFSEDVGYL